MRKSWVLATATMTALMAGGVMAGDWRSPEPPRQASHYVMASAEESRSVVQTASRSRSEASSTIQGTLPLLFVGSLLLGLGAAVRRTT